MGGEPVWSDSQDNEVTLYSVSQVAELCQVRPDTVRTWIHEHKLPAVKLSENAWRIRRSDLLVFLDNRYIGDSSAS